MRTPPVTILTSGIGLGVYIPALLIRQQLQAMGLVAEVETLEGYYTPDGQRRHLIHKAAFHDNFDLALLAHRMARGVESSLDEPSLEALLARWGEQRRRNFIVWSGFWLPVLERYRRAGFAPLRIDCCRIDAIVSPSFRAQGPLPEGAKEIWLWSWEQKRTVFELSVDEQPPLPFAGRDARLVVHGGGWGIGTYREARAQLEHSPWALDTVVHDPQEAARCRAGDRCFAVDPAWSTWDRGGHSFPPLAELGQARGVASDRHVLHDFIRCSKAIVSKPGGGTLIDSLSAATPIVLLPPLGEAEARNGALWEQLGFGISYEAWRRTGYSEVVLQELHHNLLGRKRGPDYPREYAQHLERIEHA